MEGVMITSGTSFEGYDIVEYGEYRFTQTILNSNFLKDFGTSIADIATDRSEAYQEKLDGILNSTIKAFKKMVEKTEYNAVIGFGTNVVEYSNNLTAVVASGTLVKLNQKYHSELNKSSFVRKEVFVSNYYDKTIPRAVKLILVSEGNGTKLSAWFSNYNNDDIKAVKADVSFTNLYGDTTTLTGVDFIFDKSNSSLLKSDYTDCKLPEKYIKMISSAKVYIKKYVTSRDVYLCSDEPVDIGVSYAKLKVIKSKNGIDAVDSYKSDGLVWTCNCGHINEGGAEECVICGRKQDDMKKNRSFDYEPMIAEMETKEYVIEIKDVLMKYIKEIDTNLRMQLLEIMESGLQYEKIRGNMKETVIEKVENLFLGL
ncbi:MAG: heavy metal-binding domain-containing protein [Coprococcus sp.]